MSCKFVLLAGLEFGQELLTFCRISVSFAMNVSRCIYRVISRYVDLVNLASDALR